MHRLNWTYSFRSTLILSLILLSNICFAQFSSPNTQSKNSRIRHENRNANYEYLVDRNLFFIRDVPPIFPEWDVKEWLRNHTFYPKDILSGAITSSDIPIKQRVDVKFYIEKDGTISQPQVEYSDNPELNASAIFTIQQMPVWPPNYDHEYPIRKAFILSVIFDSNDPLLLTPDVRPSFSKGNVIEWLKEKTKYTGECTVGIPRERSYVEFIIEKDGSITTPNIIRSSGDSILDNYAIEIIRQMPRWDPGYYKGNPVRSREILPITIEI